MFTQAEWARAHADRDYAIKKHSTVQAVEATEKWVRVQWCDWVASFSLPSKQIWEQQSLRSWSSILRQRLFTCALSSFLADDYGALAEEVLTPRECMVARAANQHLTDRPTTAAAPAKPLVYLEKNL
jgi:hypothetical protein